MESSKPLLDIQGVSTVFTTPQGEVTAVDGLQLRLYKGETLALVGESGSGKSVTCLSIMGLLPPTGRISEGEIWFEGRDILTISKKDRRLMCGSDMAMVFQEPMTSLNPLFKVGTQIIEFVRFREGMTKEAAWARAKDLMDMVRIPEATARLNCYPHELSGGMRQRVMIAMALAGQPKLLIADEPTTALDVTVQAQILELLRDLQKNLGMAMLFVTHDLGVVAEIADRMCVMYAGQAVESGLVSEVFSCPLMPYTAGLIRSVPTLKETTDSARLYTIPGQGPKPGQISSGCAFAPRCERVEDMCRQQTIEVQAFGTRSVRCRRSGEWATT